MCAVESGPGSDCESIWNAHYTGSGHCNIDFRISSGTSQANYYAPSSMRIKPRLMCLIIALWRGRIGTAAAFWSSRTTAKCLVFSRRSTNKRRTNHQIEVSAIGNLKVFWGKLQFFYRDHHQEDKFHHEVSDGDDDDDATVSLQPDSSLNFQAAF